MCACPPPGAKPLALMPQSRKNSGASGMPCSVKNSVRCSYRFHGLLDTKKIGLQAWPLAPSCSAR